MSWLENLGKPLASTQDEAARYVATELKLAVPKGWEVCAVDGNALAWNIVKTSVQPGEWPNKEYGVRLSKGLDYLFFTYGNNDVGTFGLHHVLLRSIVIDGGLLRHFGMAACLERVMSQCEPNEWGYT